MNTVKTEPVQFGSAAHAAGRAAAVVALLCCDQPRSSEEQCAALTALLWRFAEPDPAVAAADLPPLQAAAQTLYAVFAAPTVAAAADLLNAILRDHAHPPRLTAHEATPWHLHVDASDAAPWADWFLVNSAFALAQLLVEQQRRPGGICAAPECDRPFVATSQGHERQYCSSRCATRVRVAAFRQRQQQRAE